MAMYDYIREMGLEDEAYKYIAERLDWGSADEDDCELHDIPVNMIVYEQGKFNLEEWMSWEDYSSAEISVIAQQLCAAINFMHESLRMVHTDIKPGNVMIFVDERRMKRTVKLIDFDGWRFI